MNREILFRGKRADTGEWVYGYLWSERTIGVFSPLSNVDEIVVDPSTVGQYTGITDKNGKRIFEGDIVQHTSFPDEPDKIVWHETGFALKGLWYESDIKRYADKIQVIGNIYDNPELMH